MGSRRHERRDVKALVLQILTSVPEIRADLFPHWSERGPQLHLDKKQRRFSKTLSRTGGTEVGIGWACVLIGARDKIYSSNNHRALSVCQALC